MFAAASEAGGRTWPAERYDSEPLQFSPSEPDCTYRFQRKDLDINYFKPAVDITGEWPSIVAKITHSASHTVVFMSSGRAVGLPEVSTHTPPAAAVTCVPSHPPISLALPRLGSYPDNTGRNVSLQRLAAASLFSCSEDFAMIEERECGPGAQAGPDRNRPGYRLTTFESNAKTSCTLDSNTYAPLVFNGIGTNNKTKYLPTNNPEIKCLAATPKSPTQWNQIGTRLHPCFVAGNSASRARNPPSAEGC
jgi:hypothetical protein